MAGREQQASLGPLRAEQTNEWKERQQWLEGQLERVKQKYPEIYYEQLERAYGNMLQKIQGCCDKQELMMLRQFLTYLKQADHNPESIPHILEAVRKMNVSFHGSVVDSEGSLREKSNVSEKVGSQVNG